MATPPAVVRDQDTALTIISNPDYLAAVADEVNDRPRRIHNWKKLSELFTELVETHASAT